MISKLSIYALLIMFCTVLSGCDGDETIPAEVHIENQLTTQIYYETNADTWVNYVFSCVGTWSAKPAPYDIRAASHLGSNLYKFEIYSNSTGNIYWLGQIRVLDHFSDFGEAEKRTAAFDKLCDYLKNEPDYDTDGQWMRIVLEQP